MSDKNVPHLTHVQRDGVKHWVASCDCGWTDKADTKRKAVSSAEIHWLSMPVVTRSA